MSEITLKSVVEIAVKSEDLGAKAYAELAQKFKNDEQLGDIFALLAKDEILHKKQFDDILKIVPDLSVDIDEIDKSFFQGVDISKFFNIIESMPALDITKIMPVVYNFEKESVLYYSGIQDVMGSHDLLKQIIKLEKAHMSKIMNYMVSDAKFRGITDSF